MSERGGCALGWRRWPAREEVIADVQHGYRAILLHSHRPKLLKVARHLVVLPFW